MLTATDLVTEIFIHAGFHSLNVRSRKKQVWEEASSRAKAVPRKSKPAKMPSYRRFFPANQIKLGGPEMFGVNLEVSPLQGGLE